MSIIAAVGNLAQTSNSSMFTIEGLASDTIMGMNEAVPERGGQLTCDQDFKHISGKVGGADVLRDLEPFKSRSGR